MDTNVFSKYNMSRSISALCKVPQRKIITYFNIYDDELRLEIIDTTGDTVKNIFDTLDIKYMPTPTDLIIMNDTKEIDKLVTYLRLTNNLYLVK